MSILRYDILSPPWNKDQVSFPNWSKLATISWVLLNEHRLNSNYGPEPNKFNHAGLRFILTFREYAKAMKPKQQKLRYTKLKMDQR